MVIFGLIGIAGLISFKGEEEPTSLTNLPPAALAQVTEAMFVPEPPINPAPAKTTAGLSSTSSPPPTVKPSAAAQTAEVTETPTPAPSKVPLDTSVPQPMHTTVPAIPPESIRIRPSSRIAQLGQEVSVFIEANVGFGISGSEIKLKLDPAKLQVIDIIEGDLLGADPLVGLKKIDNQTGIVHYALARRGPTTTSTSTGALAVIKIRAMEATKTGVCDLTLEDVKLTNADFESKTEMQVHNGSIEVR